MCLQANVLVIGSVVRGERWRGSGDIGKAYGKFPETLSVSRTF
jgi:hypothetical protein